MQAIRDLYYALLENAEYYGILLLMFLAVFIVILAIAFIIRGKQSNTKERLGKLVGNVKSGKTTTKLLAQKQDTLAAKISKPLHKLSSIEKRSVRQKMQLTLVKAGYRSDQAIYNYLAAKILCPIVYVGIFMFTKMVYNFQTEVIVSILLLLVLGFSHLISGCF